MAVLKRTAKYILITLGVVLGLIIGTWLVLLVYVNTHEKELSSKVSALIQKRTRGDVSIGGLSVSFFRTFPILSLQLKEVVVRDSLYIQHKTDLLNASDIYLRASLPGIISGKAPVGKVVILNGNINLLTDTSGSSNEYVLRSSSATEKENSFEMPDIVLKNVNVMLANSKQQKLYKATVRSLVCAPKSRTGRMIFAINMKLDVKSIAFNTATGSYLRDKPVNGKFNLIYETESSNLLIDKVHLTLDGQPFVFDGKFGLKRDASDFELLLSTRNVMYSKAASFLREPLEKKLNEYSISKPIDLEVRVSGRSSEKKQPLVHVALEVENSAVGTPVGSFDVCSFKGTFSNRMVASKGRTDENSLIHLKDFSGKWENILVRSKNIKISNLIQPFLDCDIASDVELKSLNTLAGSRSFQFLAGKTSLNIRFKGPVMGDDSTASNINGDIKIFNAAVKYLPRNFTLSDCDGSLEFVNNDLVVSKISASVGSTRLDMKGSAKNFLSMLDVSPEKLLLTWNISSPQLHLEDFKPFLSRSAAAKTEEKRKTRFGATASKIDRLFAEGDMYINLRAPLMDYKTFKATDVEASVILKTTQINFDKVQLSHAGGTMTVSGSLENGEKFNPVTLQTEMKNMDIPKLFAAFENFGQDAVTHQNLSGKLSAKVDFSTVVNNDAKMLSESNQGKVVFLLEDGELNNFEPLIEISKKAFKKQDFRRVKFANLENTLELKGTAFIVNEMDIRSTALNLTVEGIYDFKKGTDMSIRLPLTNLTKSQAGTDISDDGKAKKGVSLRLRAKTGDDGKLKVSWDPFKRSKKNKTEVQDSTKAAISE